MVGPVARDDTGTLRSFLSTDVVDREEAVVYKLGLSVPPVALEAIVGRSGRSVDDVNREDDNVLLSDLSAAAAVRGALVDVASDGVMDILFGLAVIPESLRLDSFSVFSALLSTDCLLLLGIDVVLDRGVALIGFRALDAVDASLGLVGGWFKVDGVVLLAEAAVGRVAFVEAVVGLVRVEDFVWEVVVDLVEVMGGLFTVLDVLERAVLVVGSVPKALCGREDGRFMLHVLLLFNVESNFQCYTKLHHSNIQPRETEPKEQRSQACNGQHDQNQKS